MIDRDTVDRIYAAADIVDIIGDYVALKKKGVNYQACCPFHNEKTPSFVVSPTKGVYKCFGCGKGGNAVTFLMEHENISYPEALKMVAKRYGIEVQEKALTEEEVRRNDDRESMFVVNSWAAEYFANYLHHESEGMSVGMTYFRQQRQLSDAMIRRFGLGFCPAKGDKMSTDALAAGYKKEFLLSTGLSLLRESDGSLYDRFRDRVIFPIHNISGRIVGFGGRTLRTDKQVAKYQNSPESEIYSKKRELYGLFFAKQAIKQHDCAIMVEGYLDVISMHQAGIEHVVASSGTSLTTDQIRLLKRFTNNITVIYDGDSAGIHASLRGIDMILQEGMNVRVVLLPDGEDPDSFARAHSAQELEAYILDNEQDFLAFKARLLLQEAKGDPARKAALIKDMVQSIVQIPDAIQRSVYIKECALIMDIDERILVEEVARKRMTTSGDRETDEFLRRQAALQRREAPEEPAVDYTAKVEPGSSFEALEREIVKYLLKFGHYYFDYRSGKEEIRCNVAEVIFEELNDGDLHFQNPIYDQILAGYRSFHEELGVGVEVPMHHFFAHPNPEVCNSSVEIHTEGDNYVTSQLWKSQDIYDATDEELLSEGVPKAVTLYKSKVVERMIKELRDQLAGIDEEQQPQQHDDIMQRLANLNKVKVNLSYKLKRLIL